MTATKPTDRMRLIEFDHDNREFYRIYAELYAQGKSDVQIAKILGITRPTLRAYKDRAGLRNVLRLPNGEIVE